MKLIGYWNSKYEDRYIDPAELIDDDYYKNLDPAYDRCNFSDIINYLKSGFIVNRYIGYSECRICGKMLGTHERTDFEYIWPDQLDHYVEEHSVKLPEEFLDKIMNISHIHLVIDNDYWINYCKSMKK